MKKFIALIAALVVTVTYLTIGCVGGNDTYIDQERTINVRVNVEFVIALDSNPTTGFDWEMSYDDAMLSLEYEEYSAEKCPGLVGAGGTQYYGFKALKAGETEINVDYKRSWEEEIIDQRVFQVNIR